MRGKFRLTVRHGLPVSGVVGAGRSDLAILERLADRPRAVVEPREGLPVSRPAVSQHLRVLKDAGLVIDQAVGARRIYRADPDGLAALRDQLDQFWSQAVQSFNGAVEGTEEEQ
jgi:DNA-binding transcriptional ArsR family regulator